MPTSSLHPPIEVPDQDLWQFLFENRNRGYHDDKVLFVDAITDRQYTYAQIKHAAIDFGKGLKGLLGWGKGDVLCLYTPNSIDTPILTWGTHWAGGIVSPANPEYTADELAHQISDSGARLLATQMILLPRARKAAKLAGLPESAIILLHDERDPDRHFKHFTSIRSFAGANQQCRAKVTNPEKDLCFLVYSSGTTGKPKGVMLSHRNIIAHLMQMKVGEQDNLGWNKGVDGSGDTVLAFLPFFHIYGLTCLVHQAVARGLKSIVLPRFDINSWCDAIQKYRCTYVYIVPPVALLLAKHPDIPKYDLTSIRMMLCGAAPMTAEVQDAVYDRLKLKIRQGYGLSEASAVAHLQLWDDWKRKIGSVGRLLPSMEAKYMTLAETETGDEVEPTEVPIGQPGELWLKGPNIFLGYHKNPEATANALTPDGWFKTGDIGYQDKESDFYITDRAKELIKYKAFQVAPAELEGLLFSHDKIGDVAVVGVRSNIHGTEVPRAYVVPSSKYGGPNAVGNFGRAERNEINLWLHQRLARYKRLRGGIRFVREIPKTGSGKILRRLLKEQARKEVEEEEASEVKSKL